MARPERTLLTALVLALALGVLRAPSPGSAQMMEPITIVGYFDRTSADHPDITDEIELSTDGKNRRPFGLARVQSQIGVSGSDVFKRSLVPSVLVRGPAAMISKLDAAGPTQRVKIIGMFDLRSSGIILNGVEVAAPPPASGTGGAGGAADDGKE